MKLDRSSKVSIFCETEEQQEMVLDILEMLDMRWRVGQLPRGYTPYYPPMYFETDGDMQHFGQSREGFFYAVHSNEFRNQWIQLCIDNGRK